MVISKFKKNCQSRSIFRGIYILKHQTYKIATSNYTGVLTLDKGTVWGNGDTVPLLLMPELLVGRLTHHCKHDSRSNVLIYSLSFEMQTPLWILPPLILCFADFAFRSHHNHWHGRLGSHHQRHSNFRRSPLHAITHIWTQMIAQALRNQIEYVVSLNDIERGLLFLPIACMTLGWPRVPTTTASGRYKATKRSRVSVIRPAVYSIRRLNYSLSVRLIWTLEKGITRAFLLWSYSMDFCSISRSSWRASARIASWSLSAFW